MDRTIPGSSLLSQALELRRVYEIRRTRPFGSSGRRGQAVASSLRLTGAEGALLLATGQSEIERGPLPRLGLHPDTPTVALNDLLA